MVGKTLEGQGGDMKADETDNDDIKSVLAACTGNSPTKRSPTKRQVSTTRYFINEISLLFAHFQHLPLGTVPFTRCSLFVYY